MTTAVRTATRALPADLLYGRLLATAAQHALGGGPPARARVRSPTGARAAAARPLARPARRGRRAALAACRGPVLDIGCGPGRHLAALRAAGKPGLGVDLSPVAVAARAAAAPPRSSAPCSAHVPGAGRWRTALLLDGNIGIGGAPALLLRRARELLGARRDAHRRARPAGRADRPHAGAARGAGVVSEWFAWAQVGVDGIAALAARAGLAHEDTLAAAGRWFAVLRRP